MTPHILMHLSYYPSQPPPQHDGKTPHVLIAGAGIGGLFFALLLERAGIPYQIFEQAEDVRPVGKSIDFGVLSRETFFGFPGGNSNREDTHNPFHLTPVPRDSNDKQLILPLSFPLSAPPSYFRAFSFLLEITAHFSSFIFLGSVISLGANILPVFEQLGLYEDLKAMALPCMGNNYLDSDLRKVATLHTNHATET